jgi:hypothetical protein
MIPMADNLNHSSVDVTQELINLSLHQEGPQNAGYYRVSKFLNDYSELYLSKGFTQEQIDAQALNLKGRYNQQVYEENQKLLGMESVITNLKSFDIWEVPYLKDSYTEDNDTDEEDAEKDQDEIYADGRVVESFLAKEKLILKKKADKRKDAGALKAKRAQKVVDIVERYKLLESKVTQAIVSLNKDDASADGVHLGIGDNTLIASEYIGI